MKGCRHRARRDQNWRQVYVIEGGTQQHRLMYFDTCARCGTWLPLGPSDETPVVVEVRAAKIAACGAADSTCNTVDDANDCEECGWMDRAHDIPDDGSERDGWHAGYLAHAIAHHDNEQAAGQALSDDGTTEDMTR